MTTDALTIEHRGSVLVLHLDDGKANAFSPALIAAIAAAVRTAESDPEVRAVVVHGREGRFSGGFDLAVMGSGDVAAILDLVSAGGELVRLVYGATLPVVAACTGSAVAAGALLLLGCDVRVGVDAPAKIGLNEVAIGLTLPAWAVTIATERLSRRHLQRAVANARLMTPREAVDAGFLDEVVASGEVLERAVAVAADLAATLDPTAYAATVRRLRGAVLDTLDAQLAADRALAR